MHIETNVCDNLLGNIFYIDGKTKDTDKARMDLYDLNIKHELHLYKDGDKWLKPPAIYTLTPVVCFVHKIYQVSRWLCFELEEKCYHN